MTQWARINGDTAKAVTLVNASASMAMPAAAGTDGGLITGWRDRAGFAPTDALITVVGTNAGAMSAALGLYGGRGTKMYLIGKLNDGNAITIGGANTQFEQQVSAVGVYDYLAVGALPGAAAVTPAAGTITITAVPLILVDRV